jgi:amino acid transporter
MELSCLIPSAGSTYAYAYHSLGELSAMLAGCLLTLEYGVAVYTHDLPNYAITLTLPFHFIWSNRVPVAHAVGVINLKPGSHISEILDRRG